MAEVKKVYLGLEETPIPVGENKAGKMELLAGDDGYVTFQTSRSDIGDISVEERLYFELMRHLPSRSMLPYFKEELTLRDPNRTDPAKKSYISGYIGAPSIGKSFAFKTLGKLTHPKGALMLNCKDVDMGSIFCETVFDTSAANAEKAAIDALIMLGNKNPEQGLSGQSIELLRSALGKAFSEEVRGDKKIISIDWNGIQVTGETFEEQNYQKQVVSSCLTQVCQNEGIKTDGGAQSIGITTRDGIAIRVLDPNSADYGRPLLLDEINRAKPGTLQKLYEYTAMLADPKVEKCDVIGGGNRPVILRRDSFPPTFRVNFTGNPATEGMGSDEMDRPFISRLGVELDLMNLPDPTAKDIADRIGGSLTGVPLMQLYYSNEEEYKNNPESLTEILMAYRMGGLTAEEQAAVPAEELINIQNPLKTIAVAQKMADFFADMRLLTNPSSSLYTDPESKLSLSQEYEDYLKTLEVDLRLATKYMESASVERPVTTDGENYVKALRKKTLGKPSADFVYEKSDMKDRLATRGDRLEESLQQWMERIFKPGHSETLGILESEKDKMYKAAAEIAKTHGIGEAADGTERLKDAYNTETLYAAEAGAVRDDLAEAIEGHGITVENAKDVIAESAVTSAMGRNGIPVETKQGHTIKNVYFGLEETPIPAVTKDGILESLASAEGALTFQTARTGIEDISANERLYFELMRHLPSRSMLPYFKEELTLRDPNRTDPAKKSYISGYIGAPSIGKSFAFKTLGKLTHPKGALMLNCKDVDMGSIFCETVFDTSAANAEKAAIDAKLMLGNKNPEQGLKKESVELLKSALGEAFSEEVRDGKTIYSIDWNGIQVKGNTFEEQNYQKQVVSSCLTQVCQNEGIKTDGGAQSIGITTRDGIAIRVLDPNSADYGRPLLLDEINRAKPGTLQKLYEYTAMLADPKVDTCEVIGGGNRQVVLRRDSFPPTFRVNFTGNPATEGMGSDEMDRPFISRLGVELDLMNLPDPSEKDIADRIGGSLTGVPLMQLYYANEDFYSKNPDVFSEVLMAYRTGGLTEKEKAAIPEEELINIRNAPKTVAVAEQMAGFFADMRKITNPKSSLYTQSGLQLSQGYEDYLNSLEIDLRLVTKYIENASVEKPKTTTKANFAKVLGRGSLGKPRAEMTEKKTDMKDRLATRGDRLEESLQQWMERIFKPGHSETLGITPEEKEEMYEFAKRTASNHGIGEPILVEGRLNTSVRLKDAYNVDVSLLPDQQSDLVRNELVEMLEEKHGFKIENPEEALPAFAVNAALARVRDSASKEPETAQVRSIHVLNDNLDTLADAPIVEAILTDATVADMPETEDLVPHDTFMGALAIPALSEANMKALWNESLSTMDSLDPNDEGLKMAENRSETGIGMTTLMTNDKGEPIVTHVIVDSEAKRTIIVSENVDKKIQDMFARNGITFIDRKDPEAVAKIDKEITFMTVGREDPKQVTDFMQGALMLRDASMGETIGESLALSSAETVHNPIFVSHVERPPMINKELLVPTKKKEVPPKAMATEPVQEGTPAAAKTGIVPPPKPEPALTFPPNLRSRSRW